MPNMEEPFFSARHQKFGADCKGKLRLMKDSVSFECPSDNTRSLLIERGHIEAVHENGIQLRDGKKYHFKIDGYSDANVGSLFAKYLGLGKPDASSSEEQAAIVEVEPENTHPAKSMDDANASIEAVAPPDPTTATESPLHDVPTSLEFQASHEKFGKDCVGRLLLQPETLRFDCTAKPEDSFTVVKTHVRRIHMNGIEMESGQKYHFKLANQTDTQTQSILSNWLGSSTTTLPK